MHSHAEPLAVVSRAVEPVVLAVAELLDNAARHSQPNTTVEVGIQPVHNGACVVIDDAGVGMDGREIQNAVAMLSGRRPVDVSRLGDPPQFGFPVIGVLAARYGFSVSVDTRSPYGGVRAVVFLPSALLTQLDVDGPGTRPLRGRGGGGTGSSPDRGVVPGAGFGGDPFGSVAEPPPFGLQAGAAGGTTGDGGPTGPAAPTGATGPAAADGSTGQGAAGPSGVRGSAAAAAPGERFGATGPTGPGFGESNGSAAHAAPAAPGAPAGSAGSAGPTGPTGPVAAAGATGQGRSTGAAGPVAPGVAASPGVPAERGTPGAPGEPAASEAPLVTGTTAGGLPKRRRRPVSYTHL